MQTKLKNGAFKHVEAELHHYHATMREITLLREQILTDTPNTDENIGGGRSNLPGNPTERKGLMLASNRKLDSMNRIVQAIDYVVMQLPDEKRRLVQLKYWTKPQTLTWDGIAMQLNVSRITAIRWRQEIVEAIGMFLGW